MLRLCMPSAQLTLLLWQLLWVLRAACRLPLPSVSQHADWVRLVGGTNRNSGRVEVLSQNSWAAITNTRFGHQDAAVVCRHLGFTGGYAAAEPNTYGPSPNDAAWVTSMECSGGQGRSNADAGRQSYCDMCTFASLCPLPHAVSRCACTFQETCCVLPRRHRALVQRVRAAKGGRTACAPIWPARL